MRVVIDMDDGLVAELEQRVGKRDRSAFIAAAVEKALDDKRRWELIISSIGAISDEGHDWDPDPAAWVREQRRQDPRRSG